MEKKVDVLIVGGGILGTALLYTLSKYTNIKRVALIERRKDFALVASHTTQNSQTLHFGDIETNYTFDKASKVAPGANMVKNYLERIAMNDGCYQRQHKMVIAVGKDEVREIRARHKVFRMLFPSLKLLERKDIARIEPKVVEGRDPKQALVALYSEDGYILDYYKLAKSFVKHSKNPQVYLKTSVDKIEKKPNGYVVHTSRGVFNTKFLIVDAGAMSLYFAKKMGYGKNLSVLSVAGNFYRGPEALKGKVYTVQNPKLPFAAVHGDPDVHAKGYTRYGPTAKTLFMLERRNYSTVKSYFETFSYNVHSFISIAKILSDWTILSYILKNLLYDIPFFGKRLFVKNVQKIIPTTKASDIRKDRGYGGTRPQIVDINTHQLSLGEARIEDDRIIFNITPSPGASTCLAIARRDALKAAQKLSKSFDTGQFDSDLG